MILKISLVVVFLALISGLLLALVYLGPEGKIKRLAREWDSSLAEYYKQEIGEDRTDYRERNPDIKGEKK